MPMERKVKIIVGRNLSRTPVDYSAKKAAKSFASAHGFWSNVSSPRLAFRRSAAALKLEYYRSRFRIHDGDFKLSRGGGSEKAAANQKAAFREMLAAESERRQNGNCNQRCLQPELLQEALNRAA
jgi:hypothetical protein